MRRLIQKEIEDPLSLLALEGKINGEAYVDCADGALVVKPKKSRQAKSSAKKEKEMQGAV